MHEFRKATKRPKKHPDSTKRTNTSVWGSNGMDLVRSLRKIPTRLRGMNFCTSSARFAPSFITQTKRSSMHPNRTKHTKTSVYGAMGWIGCVRCEKFRQKRLRGTNFCTSSARFAPSFVRQPDGPECNQIVRNTPKHQFRVQQGGSSAFVVKNSDVTSWHELLH